MLTARPRELKFLAHDGVWVRLEGWVEHGSAPERIVATKLNSPLTRPLCAYPRLARYKGSGDTNDPASFDCAAP